MIKLMVEDYCQNCNEFEPKCDVDERTYYDAFGNGQGQVVNTYVKCEHETRCRSICNTIRENVLMQDKERIVEELR